MGVDLPGKGGKYEFFDKLCRVEVKLSCPWVVEGVVSVGDLVAW